MPEGLSRRVGPLPVWGWIVVAIAAFVVWRRKTEPGWFPLSVAPSTAAAPGTVRAFVASIGRSSDEGDEPGGEAPMMLSLSGAGRPTLPVPITEGGPDGTTGGGGAAQVLAASDMTSLDPRFTVVGKSGEPSLVMPAGSAQPRPGGISSVLGSRTVRRTFGRTGGGGRVR